MSDNQDIAKRIKELSQMLSVGKISYKEFSRAKKELFSSEKNSDKISMSDVSVQSAKTDRTLSVRANVFWKLFYVGGILNINEKGIEFEPLFNFFLKRKLELSYTEMTNVGIRNALRVFPCGFYIETRNKKHYKFILWERDKIVDFIKLNIKNVYTNRNSAL